VESAGGPVEKLAESGAVEIVLNIAVVVVIEEVVDAKSDPCMPFFYGEANAAPDLQVCRDETGELRFISRPDEFAVLVDV
jgi:hypothetical protein